MIPAIGHKTFQTPSFHPRESQRLLFVGKNFDPSPVLSLYCSMRLGHGGVLKYD